MKAIKHLQQALLGLILPAILMSVAVAFIDQSTNLHMFKYRSQSAYATPATTAQEVAPVPAPIASKPSSGLVPPPPPFPFGFFK